MTQTAPAANIWLVTATIMIGTVAAIMGASTVNVALPDIMSGLGISQDQISWVSTAYMLANVIAIPTAAWLGDLLSKRVLFGSSLAVFLAGSMLCGMSWDFSSMIAFRVLQGLAAGLIMPTAQSLIFENFPAEKRGLGMGVYGMGAIMGPAIGPTLGGYLVEFFDWRAIFYINLPFAVTSLLMLTLLPSGARKPSLKFDAPGFISLAVCLSALQIALTNGAKDGWGAPYIVACYAACFIAGGYMIVRELTIEAPMLDFGVFRYGTYNAATAVSLILGLGLYGSTFIVPLYLGNLLGYTALETGLVMLPGSLVMGVMMLVGGRLSDLVDNRLLLILGLSLFAYFLWLTSTATLDSSRSFYAWALVWRGLGMGFLFSPLSAIALGGVPPRLLSQASGIFNLTRQLAGTIGIAFLNTLLISRMAFHRAVLGQAMALAPANSQHFVALERLSLLGQGYTPQSAGQMASLLLAKQASLQVAAQSYSDLFIVCIAVTLAGIIPAATLKRKPKAS